MPVVYARLKSRWFAARTFYSCALAALVLLFGARVLQNAVAEGDTRTISLHHVHTDENITITFKRDGRYDEAALEKLNWFLRDWRREKETRIDPHLIDLIWEVQRETGSQEPVRVVCGYRSPETNAMLRRRSNGVARFSQHMLGHAMDFYIPGVPLAELRVIGLRLQRGGVGFYPTSGSPFVHMDTGGVRHWPRMTREQLVRVFPDGRTVHIPSDGRPLPGYALALADIRKHGSNPSEMSIEAARGAGIQVADAGVTPHSVNPFARLFGLGRNNDEDDDATAAAAPATPTAAVPLRTRAKAAMTAAIERAEDKLAAEKTKLVQVAANAEGKLAAEKTKFVRAASKVHVISRAEASPLAAVTPNQIILARGFWQGVPDGANAARPATAANPLGLRGPQRAEVASAAPDATGSVSPFADAAEDRVPAELALAYAEPTDRDAPSSAASAVAAAAIPTAATPRAAVTRAVAVRTERHRGDHRHEADRGPAGLRHSHGRQQNGAAGGERTTRQSVAARHRGVAERHPLPLHHRARRPRFPHLDAADGQARQFGADDVRRRPAARADAGSFQRQRHRLRVDGDLPAAHRRAGVVPFVIATERSDGAIRLDCFASLAMTSCKLPQHAQRVQVGFQDRLLLLALVDVQLAQPDDGAQRLDVEAVALGFGVDVADVVGERLLFLFEPLDALDEGLEVILGEAVRSLFVFGGGGGGHRMLLPSLPRAFESARLQVKARARSSTALHRTIAEKNRHQWLWLAFSNAAFWLGDASF